MGTAPTTSVFTVTIDPNDVTVSCNRCRERMGYDLTRPDSPCVHEAVLELCMDMDQHWRQQHA